MDLKRITSNSLRTKLIGNRPIKLGKLIYLHQSYTKGLGSEQFSSSCMTFGHEKLN